jgi:BirA family biotin operon repressor/biotin-[acetyl-CoA-carboxylase] ligase
MRAESVIAGFGVNVRRASLPEDVAGRATSLEAEGALDLDRGALLADIVVGIERHVRAYETHGLAASLDALRARDVARGRRVEGESVRGIAAGIDDEGRLLVDGESGSRVAVASGEVVFV